MLELVGLSQFAKRYPNQLSGGLFAAGEVTGCVHGANRLIGLLWPTLWSLAASPVAAQPPTQVHSNRISIKKGLPFQSSSLGGSLFSCFLGAKMWKARIKRAEC